MGLLFDGMELRLAIHQALGRFYRQLAANERWRRKLIRCHIAHLDLKLHYVATSWRPHESLIQWRRTRTNEHLD